MKKITLRSIFNRVLNFNLVLLLKPLIFVIFLLVFYFFISFFYNKYIEYERGLQTEKMLSQAQDKWDLNKECIEGLDDLFVYKEKLKAYFKCSSENSLENNYLYNFYIDNEELGLQFLRALKNNHAEGRRPQRCYEGQCY